MRRMLFNATQPEELRVAIVNGQKLVDLDIECISKEQRKSNIYKAVVTRLEPSLEAAFVDYGCERHGFLPFKEISPYGLDKYSNASQGRVQDFLQEGMELIVQVDKDERGSKGAALTTYISLAGRYLVLIPNNPNSGGVSRRITGDERNEMREVLGKLEIPEGMSVIARTAGIGRSEEELQWDLNYLTQLWRAIEEAANNQGGVFLIYQESSLVIRAIRDYFNYEIGEILIDSREIYEQAYQFMSHVMPSNVDRLKFYHDDVPLFSRFQIEHQIETAYSRQVNLVSGGAIVIDHTEALVSIDVNSARAIRGTDIEHTALNTNLEAADEIARQLRLRDLGGLIVIDFIDMDASRNQREVEARLHEALRQDRARIQVGRISRFGLLELSRQRLRPSLGESNYTPCTRCHGTGYIRGTDSSALHVLRIIQEEAMKEHTSALHVQLPIDVATFLLNEKRAEIYEIEERLKVDIILIPNIHLETPKYKITRLRHDESKQAEIQASYKMVEKVTDDILPELAEKKQKAERTKAAVQGITPAQPAPMREEKSRESSLLDKFFGWFKPAGSMETEGKIEQSTEQEISKEKDTSSVQDKPKKSSRGRGRSRSRGERKDVSKTKKSKQSKSSENNAVSENVIDDKTLTNSESLETQESFDFVTESTEASTTAQLLHEDPSQTLAEEEPSSVAASNSEKTSEPRSDEKKRPRRRRGSRQKDRTRTKKVTSEQKETATSALPEGTTEGATEDTEEIEKTPLPHKKESEQKETDVQIDNGGIAPVDTHAETEQSEYELKSSESARATTEAGTISKKEKKKTSNVDTKAEQPEDTARAANIESTPASSISEQAPSSLDESPANSLKLEESGLVMIETPPEKIDLTDTADEHEPPKRQRKRTQKTPANTEETEKLTQIETRK